MKHPYRSIITIVLVLMLLAYFIFGTGRAFISFFIIDHNLSGLCVLTYNTRDCKEGISENQAKQNADIQKCLTLKYDKRECVEAVTQITGNEDDCVYAEVANDTYCREHARIVTAVKQKNKSVCDAMTIPSIQSECYNQVGVETGDSSYCDMATNDTWARPTCLHDLAVKTGDSTVCSRIGNFGNWMSVCYEDVAIKNKDISICGLVTPVMYDDERGICFRGAAKALGGTFRKKICESMTHVDQAKLRTECLSALGDSF